MRNVPTPVNALIDMKFNDNIGLYASESDKPSEQRLSPADLAAHSSSSQSPEQVYDLGLVDDYTNEGNFTVNVLRELSTLKRFSEMLD